METLPGLTAFRLSDVESGIERQRAMWANPTRTKDEIRYEIENVLSEARFARPRSWHAFSDFKRRLAKLVGHFADYPFFPESTDYEAVMCRLVRALAIDTDYGRIKQHHKSELWIATKDNRSWL